MHDPIVIHSTKPFDANKYIYPTEYEGHFDSVLIDHDEIRRRIRELGQLIVNDYKGKGRPVFICTLKGACTFFIHLLDVLQTLRFGYDIEFIRASSYDGINTTGSVSLCYNNELLNIESIRNRHVLLLEDIVDTGTTLCHVVPLLQNEGKPLSIEVCTLLDKRLDDDNNNNTNNEQQQHSVTKQYTAKYCGFSIPNYFIIGYGLDYNELYRDLQDIYVISEKGIQFKYAQYLLDQHPSTENEVQSSTPK